MGRQYVHLSKDPEIAVLVGGRKSPRPEILVIDAAAANRAGVVFYRGSELIQVAHHIPLNSFDAFPGISAPRRLTPPRTKTDQLGAECLEPEGVPRPRIALCLPLEPCVRLLIGSTAY